MNVWDELHHLFKDDDGSLPDIFVENISPEQSIEIYSWVLSLTRPCRNSSLWSIEQEKELEIHKIPNPALYYVQGKAESFRHGLEVFKFNGVQIPQLSIALDESGIEFDYRMGKHWGANELEALFEFLYQIKCLAPGAKITQAFEGRHNERNEEFSSVFEEYVVKHNV